MRFEYTAACFVIASLAASCGAGPARALAVVPRNEALHRLSIRLVELDNDAELMVRDGGRVSVRLTGANRVADVADPEHWDVRINGDCGLSYGPTERQLIRRGPHDAEAVYDFDWPGLAAARRLTVVVLRSDIELRYVWRFAD